MAGQLRILATSVAGLPAALDAAVTRLQATITETVLTAVRERISDEIDAAVAALPPSSPPTTGGGGGRRGSAVIDCGPLPVPELWTIIDDPKITPTSYVLGWVAAQAPGKDDDEAGMDVIDVWLSPGAGFLELRLTGMTGFIADQFRIDYLVTET